MAARPSNAVGQGHEKTVHDRRAAIAAAAACVRTDAARILLG
jgi:hypothetical protein